MLFLSLFSKNGNNVQAGHDLERKDLIRELKSYDVGEEPAFYPWVEIIKSQQGSLYWHTG